MPRVLKQILYGFCYLVVIGFFVWGFYGAFVKPAPSCVDNIKNQDETDVDCGGRYCISCEIKHLAPISFQPVQILAGGDAGHSIAIAEIRNPNARFGLPSLTYELQIFTTSTQVAAYSEQVTVPMYPSEIKYRVSVNVPVSIRSITRAQAVEVSRSPSWRTVDEFSKPVLPTREVKVANTATQLVVNGIVKNDNPFPLRRATIAALFSDENGQLIIASRSVVNDLVASEERSFQIVAPLPASFAGKPLPTPRIIIDGER